ncbi:adenylate cyclase [Rhodobacteraceae bacterium B1Z28]|uniref:Adenylate cyclase n=1 Tax=Ruegeria haliotis TaxID=2747601 RepID=A0ABX2PXH7_9RHOB|nr:adenylate cyclase [Ruegeria haliotis]NVO58237.1 adenylate cyclase [Ruegeria haliotis]
MTTAESAEQRGDARPFSSEEIDAALQRVLASNEFSGSARMQSFLTYVVAETLAGRKDSIRAKTIAMDVYGYDVDDLSKREGVVRVDAGRVRRKLDAYYEGKGTSDPVVILLPVGSYVPEFKHGASDLSQQQRRQRNILKTAIIAATALVIGGSLIAMHFWRSAQSVIASEGYTTLYDVAPVRIEAMNLCNAGRELIFPVVNLSRLSPALLVFEAAIERDPHYFCGYAGAAQVETMLALLQPEQPDTDRLLQAAAKNSARALNLAPDASWALSARAWLEFGLGNHERAIVLSTRAVDLSPHNPHIAEFDALILLYTSRFNRILEQSDHYKELSKHSGGLVFDNALGSAQFHTGDYAAAIQTYEETIAHGGPFGPISAAYLMAAHWENGEQSEARRLAALYNQTWPDFPLESIKRRAFSTSEPVHALITAMKAAGWSGNRLEINRHSE